MLTYVHKFFEFLPSRKCYLAGLNKSILMRRICNEEIVTLWLKTGRKSLNQVIKLNITNNKVYWYYVSPDIMPLEGHIMVLSPKLYNISLIMRKCQINPLKGQCTKHITIILLTCQIHEKQEKTEEYSQIGRDQGGMAND